MKRRTGMCRMRQAGIAILMMSQLACWYVPYRRIDRFHLMGYSDRKIADGLYYVWVEAVEEPAKNEPFKLRRSAELTLENGCRYFVILTKKNQSLYFSDLDPAQLRLVFSGHIFRVLPSREGILDAVDAVTVIQETNALARGLLSWKATRAFARLTK